MWKFIQHELKYWIKSPMLWIFLFINTMLIFFAVSSDSLTIGGAVGNTKRNAPFVIENYYAIMSLICLLMTTAFMNATANRDFSSGMHQFVFSSPIKKSHYYFGKFTGAVIISVIPLLGVTIGSLIAPFLSPIFDMSPADRFGPVVWSGHFWGIVAFAIPNVIVSGTIIYGLAILFRSNIVSFIGSMLLIVLYAVSSGFTDDIKKEWLANLLDPFGFRPFGIITKYMTIDEKNTNTVALVGELLNNRLIWLAISLVLLLLIYNRFSFAAKNEKVKKAKKVKVQTAPIIVFNDSLQPTKANAFSFITFIKLILFETKAVIKNPTFIILSGIGMINLIASLTSFTGNYGTKQYPVTYDIVGTIEGSFLIFIIGFITFYAGVLVWRERDAKINEIKDATPIQTSILFLTKLIAVCIALALIMTMAIIVGVITQTCYGYFNYELDVYFKSLFLIRLSSFIFLTVLAMLFHYLINNRYIAYFAFVAFYILNSILFSLFEIDTNMLQFGNRPSVTYSDMNGFGPFISGLTWFSIYWVLFCVILCFIIIAFYIRGKESEFKNRLVAAKNNLYKNKVGFGISILAFALCSGFVYYNTKVLNTYDSTDQTEKNQVAYEKKYKKYENLTQPKFYKFEYNIDLIPENRSFKANVSAWVRNISNKTINELHFNMPLLTDTLRIEILGAKMKLNDDKLRYQIYTLAKPLQPNDSLKINFVLATQTKGFENEVTFTQLTQNGTFFNNSDIMPSFGYDRNTEISDLNKRKKLKLPARIRTAKLNENDLEARSKTYITDDSNWVNLTTTISTAPDQTAIAPGSLIKTWKSNGRNYFTYKLDQKSLDFYSFISAKYEVARKKWNGIDLEVYYDKKHATNVPNMLKSLQKSLEYYTKNFGPYYHKQCRIVEFPRYAGFAQAFPGTMPYSESIGFIADLRDVTKNDIDQVYYVVAHEMGHQWWAHQVCGAAMQGSEFFSEGFAQYSALMVMEKEYGKDKMKKFLEYEMNGYLSGRSREREGENPLIKTENQSYIHYQKASVVMYYLKEMIGEDKVNHAMKNIIDKFAYKNPPYATSIDVINEFKKVTPTELQYLITDMFENITVFSNRMVAAKYKKVGNEYEVTLTTTSQKFRSNLLGKETEIPVNDFIDVALFAKSDNDNNQTGKVLLTQRVKITKKDNMFKFKIKELPYNAGIDPYNYLIDRVPDDNLKTMEE
jgi:ABC-2 type transport system permease protein